MTGVELRLLTEPHGNDQLLFLQRGIRGGVSTITHRYANANLDDMGTDYNPNDPLKYLMYLDANNLYGHAMRQMLPVDGIKFLTDKEVLEFDLTAKLATNSKGYILEVDLDYPDELHDAHNDYPLVPESILVTADMISPYECALGEKFGTNFKTKVEKLVPNLLSKTLCVIHYRNIKVNNITQNTIVIYSRLYLLRKSR